MDSTVQFGWYITVQCIEQYIMTLLVENEREGLRWEFIKEIFKRKSKKTLLRPRKIASFNISYFFSFINSHRCAVRFYEIFCDCFCVFLADEEIGRKMLML